MLAQTGTVLSNLAALSIAEGDPQRALLEANEAVVIFERLANGPQAATALLHIAHARLVSGESELARETLGAAREKVRQEPTIRNTIGVSEIVFLFACDLAAFEPAAEILGFVDASREKHHLLRPASLGEIKRHERELRLRLGKLFDVAFERGRAGSAADMEELLDVVLARVPNALSLTARRG